MLKPITSIKPVMAEAIIDKKVICNLLKSLDDEVSSVKEFNVNWTAEKLCSNNFVIL